MMRCHPRWSDKSEMIEVTAMIRGGREKKRGLSRDFEYSRFDQVFDPRTLDGFDRSKLDVRIEGRNHTWANHVHYQTPDGALCRGPSIKRK